jgi:hypothetical protein
MVNKSLPLEKELETIFLHKLPAFQENTKEFFVKYGPYILLILAIMGLLGLLTAFGILGSFSVYSTMFSHSGGLLINSWLSIILSIVSLTLIFMAFTPLKNRQRKGWEYLYYSVLVSLASHLIAFQLLLFIVSGFLWFWVLFQIREKYS